jgi:hypothetical protein
VELENNISAVLLPFRFMKLRLDRVLKLELGEIDEKEMLACGAPVPDFGRPQIWTAPYPKYAAGWWNPFMPGRVDK